LRDTDDTDISSCVAARDRLRCSTTASRQCKVSIKMVSKVCR